MDKEQKIEYYQDMAKNGCPDAMCKLAKIYYEDGNLEKAIELFTKSAEKGNSEAKYYIGLSYKDGKGNEKNMEKAINIISQAANENNPLALNEMAYVYENGLPGLVEPNEKKAMDVYKKMDKNNDPVGKFKLAELYKKNNISNITDLVRLYQESAELNYAPSQIQMAKFYKEGIGVEQNQITAKMWHDIAIDNNAKISETYESGVFDDEGEYMMNLMLENNGTPNGIEEIMEMAKAGHIASQYAMGKYFYEGKYVKQDNASAAAMWSLSAREEHPKSQSLLAQMYEFGIGVPKNNEKAKKLHMQAAENGIPESQYFIGSAYNSGDFGFPQNTETAIEWFEKAAEAEIELAQYELGKIYSISSDKKIVKMAIFWYQEAANNGHQMSGFDLGVVFCHHDDLITDLELAAKWILFSAQLGYKLAQKKISIMYEKGLGLKKDSKQAKYWAKKYNNNN